MIGLIKTQDWDNKSREHLIVFFYYPYYIFVGHLIPSKRGIFNIEGDVVFTVWELREGKMTFLPLEYIFNYGIKENLGHVLFNHSCRDKKERKQAVNYSPQKFYC